jgi:hypothetical protein
MPGLPAVTNLDFIIAKQHSFSSLDTKAGFFSKSSRNLLI